MQTRLSLFCHGFHRTVEPLLLPMQRSTAELEAASSSLPVRQVLPKLREKRHQLRVLVDKVAEQHAYVLIFGPLKSGKSTLMNALTGAYVSEVTSLPAYPCLVYVSHAEEEEFVLTRYHGATESLSDPAFLRDRIDSAHKELAERIREIEGRGGKFDPSVHFSEAIRRVDVKVPAGDLAQSGAVLVDTPGLYARMKFGYDQMTHDFRDAAACALFVVKTDNLFLEQVFEEFNALLQMFSKVFLVVNLDGSKQDLRLDGSLMPSLERRDPAQIIEAFHDLSMSAPLKEAVDRGDVRIYPVDLLHAASFRLAGLGRAQAADDADDVDSAIEIEANHRDLNPSGFDELLRDLTNYLNSSEYVDVFIRDNVRYVRTLLEETLAITRHPEVRDLERRRGELESELAHGDTLRQALTRLERHDWDPAFAQLKDELLRSLAESARAIEDRANVALVAAMDTWFTSRGSLQDLAKRALAQVFDDCQREVAQTGVRELGARLGNALGGFASDQVPEQDLDLARIRVEAISRSSFDRLQIDESVVGFPALHFDTDAIPLKKSLWDWVLLRPQRRIRRRIFGDPKKPVRPISPEMKRRHLPEASRAALVAVAENHLRHHASMAWKSALEKVFECYRQTLLQALRERIRAEGEGNARRLSLLAGRQAELQRIRTELGHLETAMIQGTELVERLSVRHDVQVRDAVTADETAPSQVDKLPEEEGLPEEGIEDALPREESVEPERFSRSSDWPNPGRTAHHAPRERQEETEPHPPRES